MLISSNKLKEKKRAEETAPSVLTKYIPRNMDGWNRPLPSRYFLLHYKQWHLMKNWNITNIFHSNHRSNSIALWEVLNQPLQKSILERLSCQKKTDEIIYYVPMKSFINIFTTGHFEGPHDREVWCVLQSPGYLVELSPILILMSEFSLFGGHCHP